MRLIRENYLRQIRPYYEADLIKVITGVRRAGKSVILESIRDELMQSGNRDALLARMRVAVVVADVVEESPVVEHSDAE